MFILMFYLILFTTLLDWFLSKTDKKEMPLNSPAKYSPEDIDIALKELMVMDPTLKISREQVVELLNIIRENGGETKKALDMANQFIFKIKQETIQPQHLSHIFTESSPTFPTNVLEYITQFSVITGISVIGFLVLLFLSLRIFQHIYNKCKKK